MALRAAPGQCRPHLHSHFTGASSQGPSPQSCSLPCSVQPGRADLLCEASCMAAELHKSTQVGVLQPLFPYQRQYPGPAGLSAAGIQTLSAAVDSHRFVIHYASTPAAPAAPTCCSRACTASCCCLRVASAPSASLACSCTSCRSRRRAVGDSGCCASCSASATAACCLAVCTDTGRVWPAGTHVMTEVQPPCTISCCTAAWHSADAQGDCC